MSILHLFSLFLVLFLNFEEGWSREYRTYSNSYVYLSATNKKLGNRIDMCVNYQQYRENEIAETYETAQPYSMLWWKNKDGNTRICPLPTPSERRTMYSGSVVPLEYRIDDDYTPCTQPFVSTPTAFRNASQFQETQLKIYNASVAMFILDKGRQFVQGWRDYLFTDFHDPYINSSEVLPTFYIYRDDFNNKMMSVLNKNSIEELELRFHRPKNGVIDLSMIIIWLIAMICIAGGGFWAFYRHRLGKDSMPPDLEATNAISQNSNGEEKESCCLKYANYVLICVLMIVLVTVIMLGYYFRNVLVFFFNVMLVLFGTSSVQSCIRALLSNFSFSTKQWYTAEIGWIPMCCGQTKRISYTGVVIGILSFLLCLKWYFIRLTPYAFILLDFINMTICLHILKSLRLPSLKWIFILMTCMFVYDAIMVFATPYWTKNGCSVMLEVATGLDCANGRANSSGYPLPPIAMDSPPERFPMLMQVMHFDPMMTCIDLEVERSYQMSILGLGDIIIPGYLVSHSFTMNGFPEKTRLLYGIICIIGYGIGLIATFFALTIMKMAQPALIYLVPFTLIPICVTALIRNEFNKVWNGVPIDKSVLKEDGAEAAEAMVSSTTSENGEQSV